MKNGQIVTKIGALIQSFNPLSRRESQDATKERGVSIEEQKHNDITWMDIQNPLLKDLSFLREKHSFHPLHLAACLSRGQLDRLETEEKYLFVLIHAPKYNKKENKIVTNRICFFLGKKFVITVHRSSHPVLSALFQEAQESQEKRDELFKKSPGYLMYQLLDVLTKDMVVLQDMVLKEVDEIEDLVFDVNVSGAFEITQLRQKIVRLKRVTSSYKNILQGLAADQSQFTSALTRYFNSLTNEMNKLRELLEEAKEVVEIYKDADFTVSTERTNKILGILTIIFTLGIPATIIGSFYGMNVLIPGGLEAGPWTFLGPFTTFYMVIIAAVVPALVMLWAFKHKKWF